MINKTIIALLMITLVFTPLMSTTEYHTILQPTSNGETTISWSIEESPDVPVEWGWSGEGAWMTEEESSMTFRITNITDVVEGTLHIGNLTITTNDTTIARELVIGVWGLTPFFPGLVVPIGDENMQILNETARASAERVSGNYMNGTMIVSEQAIEVDDTSYECITFDYEQDSSGYAQPQITHLAYDCETGVLVWANTSYSFGTPYNLCLSLEMIAPPSPSSILALVGIAVIAVVAIIIIIKVREG
ncbi:MAG: hypothetical protein R6V83_04685 [Candidatus Thorarchaeota archaeon]